MYESDGYLETLKRSSDEEATELTTDSTIPSSDQGVDVTVKQDTDGDGTADNEETITLSGGSDETNTLDNFSASTGADYWVRIDLTTSDDSDTPEFSSAALNISTADITDTASKVSWTFTTEGTSTYDQDDVASKTDLAFSPSEAPISRLDIYGSRDVEMVWTSRQTQEAKVRLATAEKTLWSWTPREAPAVIQDQDTTGTKEPFSWSSRTARSRRSRRADRDVKWIINNIGTDGLVENHPEVSHGQTSTFTFIFSPRGDPDHGRSHLKRYEDVRDIIKIADAAAYGTDEDGRPWFIEQHTSQETILVELVPGSQSRGAKGVWGVVTGADDQTTSPGEQCILSLDVFVVANSRDYTDRQEVRQDFQVQRV